MLVRICTSSSRSPEYSVAHDSVGLPPVNTIVEESIWVKDDICHFGFNIAQIQKSWVQDLKADLSKTKEPVLSNGPASLD